MNKIQILCTQIFLFMGSAPGRKFCSRIQRSAQTDQTLHLLSKSVPAWSTYRISKECTDAQEQTLI